MDLSYFIFNPGFHNIRKENTLFVENVNIEHLLQYAEERNILISLNDKEEFLLQYYLSNINNRLEKEFLINPKKLIILNNEFNEISNIMKRLKEDFFNLLSEEIRLIEEHLQEKADIEIFIDRTIISNVNDSFMNQFYFEKYFKNITSKILLVSGETKLFVFSKEIYDLNFLKIFGYTISNNKNFIEIPINYVEENFIEEFQELELKELEKNKYTEISKINEMLNFFKEQENFKEEIMGELFEGIKKIIGMDMDTNSKNNLIDLLSKNQKEFLKDKDLFSLMKKEGISKSNEHEMEKS